MMSIADLACTIRRIHCQPSMASQTGATSKVYDSDDAFKASAAHKRSESPWECPQQRHCVDRQCFAGHKSNYTFDVDGSLLSSSYIIQRGAGSCHISNRSLRMAVTTTKWNSDDESSIDKPVVAASKPGRMERRSLPGVGFP